MRYFIFIILFATACSDGRQVVNGTMGELKAEKMYLCEVENEYRGVHQVIDSAVVTEGKFSFTGERGEAKLYFIGDNAQHGGYFFWDGSKITLSLEKVTEDEITWQVSGSPTDATYRTFLNEHYQETGQGVLDSLDMLFYQAREVRDTAEMRRIKELSMPHYKDASVQSKQIVNRWIAAQKENIFGLYLYFSRQFAHKDFPTVESIAAEKQYLQSFGEAVQNSAYMHRMNETLAVYENCAIGHQAPEIVGVDTLGNTLKLSDLKGKYVIVDFWNSYCKWCRLETPYLLNVQAQFAGKELVILGVSSDYYKDKWMDAIHEDKSYWTHILVEKSNINPLFDSYCIKGIPHIILVGPDGKILAKELRGDDIATITASFVK